MFNHLRPALVMIFLFTALTGIAYPLVITGLAQLVFHDAANGSLLRGRDGHVLGSKLIGQSFSGPQYFHPRPSAAGAGYDASNSSGSNMGPLSSKLADRVAADVAALRKDAPGAAIPADAVTASASGLDPDISPAYAERQVARIAAARRVDVAALTAMVDAAAEGRLFGFIGQPRVNVLALNLAVDRRFPPH
jgi:K+-transporting ATPase ATPase C chain